MYSLMASGNVARRLAPEIGTPVVCCCLCTSGRSSSLMACLNSLITQRFDPQRINLQLVVVENSPHELGLASNVPYWVTVIHEPRLGIPFARNAALDAAGNMQADFVAFIDDDEIAPPDWIARLFEAIDGTNADVVQGSWVRVPETEMAISRARLWSHSEWMTPKCKWQKTAATNNVLFRSWIVEPPYSLRFDEGLCVIGGSDTEFFMRASDTGAGILRVSSPPVFEVWSAERESFKLKCMRAFRVGACTNYRYRKNRGRLLALAMLLVRSLWRTITGAGRVIAGSAVSLLPVKYRGAQKQIDRGIAAICFAAGCILPYMSLLPKRYY